MEPLAANAYEIIRKWERSQAGAIAVMVVPPHRISVWDVMIPVVFILNYMRTKERRGIFVENHLYTKMLALDGAWEVCGNRCDREEALAGIRDKTEQVLAADTQGLYSKDIREKQMAEIALLLDHYVRLMQAGGSDYAELVRRAYPDPEDFRRFLNRLEDAEAAVQAAAGRTLGERVDTGILEKLRYHASRLREKSIHTIYGNEPDSRQC